MMPDRVMTKTEWREAEVDAEVERILAMSDDEIIAEAVAEGMDPEIVAAEMQAMVSKLLGRKPQ